MLLDFRADVVVCNRRMEDLLRKEFQCFIDILWDTNRIDHIIYMRF